MKKILIVVICILLICCAGVFLCTGKTTGTINSFTNNVCTIGKYEYGQSYMTKYVVDNQEYYGDSECTKIGLLFGENVDIYYAKFNKKLILPYKRLMVTLGGLTAVMALILVILLITGKQAAKE